MTTIQKAIQYAEEHRQTHIEWLDYWRTYPPKTHEEREIQKSVGGVKHQSRSIQRYNIILAALNGRSER